MICMPRSNLPEDRKHICQENLARVSRTYAPAAVLDRFIRWGGRGKGLMATENGAIRNASRKKNKGRLR